jgi:hypothetical protein
MMAVEDDRRRRIVVLSIVVFFPEIFKMENLKTSVVGLGKLRTT